MIFTTPMRLLAAVVLDEASEEVSRELLRQGALDFVSIRDLPGDWKDRVEPLPANVSLARIGELRKRLEGFFEMTERSVPLPEPSVDNLTPLDIPASEKTLDSLAAEVNGIRERQKEAQEEIRKLSEIRRQLELFEGLGKPGGTESPYSFLVIRTGIVDASRFAALEESMAALPSVLIRAGSGGETSAGALLVTLKRDDSRVQPLLSRAGWEDMKLPTDLGTGKENALRELDGKMESLRVRQEEYQAKLQDVFSRKSESLAALWSSLRVHELLARMQSSFSRTGRTVLFSGWIPRERQEAVETGIRGASNGRCYLEWLSPGEGEAKTLEAPVVMDNPKILRPFESLVRNYAIPEYGTIDPTPFVAAAYLCMFGLMFGDAGHGLVIALAGVLGILGARRKNRNDTLYRLFVYCGLAAVASGALFGSYFGYPLLPPLWFDYHGIVAGHSTSASGGVRSVYDILGITIKFGMIIMGTGLILNWINLVRKKRWLPLLLDKGGLLGGWIYGAGAWAAFYFVGHNYKELPPVSLLALLLGIPTLALALKGPLEYFLHDREHRKKFGALTIMDFFMEWIVEILEIYSGYLANTLSFMRVAGLGIAHVSLMMAFSQIARMITPEGPLSLPAVLILVLGNVLVIALEGLSAGIQSLRLNYYEFFSKYFNGTGRAYRPISLKSQE